MDLREYQRLAMRTSPEGHDRVLNGCLGLIGESGEVVDCVKKWKFQSGDDAPMPVEKLTDELGDVMWYVSETCVGLGLDIEELVDDGMLLDGMVRDRVGLVEAAVRLSGLCHEPYDDRRRGVLQLEMQKINLTRIVRNVRYILEVYALTTLEEALRRNIEKLKKRYPNGFEAERSLHRAE